jgi:hypothetical protein
MTSTPTSYWYHGDGILAPHVVWPNLYLIEHPELAEAIGSLTTPQKPKHPLPHADDETLQKALRDFLRSDWLVTPIATGESIRTFTQQLLSKGVPESSVTESTSISRGHRRGALARVCLLVHFGLTTADALREEKEETTRLEEEVSDLKEELAKVKETLHSTRTALQEGAKTLREWDLATRCLDTDAFDAGLNTPAEGEVRPIPDPENTRPDFDKKLSPAYLASRLIAIRTACRTGRLSAMVQHLAFLPDAGAPVIPAVWQAIPESIRGSEPEPQDLATLNAFLTRIPLGSCTHPTELGTVLNNPAQEWNTSLDVVRDLMTAAPPPAQVTEARTKLFKTSEVPEFKDTTQYEAFRTQLKSFFQAEDEPAPHEFGRAMRRVLTSFKDPVAIAAQAGWDISPLVHHTWTQTQEAFLSALDKKFQKATILEDAIADYMKCRPKESELPSDFFNRFEAVTNQRREIEKRKGMTPEQQLSDQAVTSRLLAVVPRYLVDNVRLAMARNGQILEVQPLSVLRPEFERAWAYVQPPPPKNPRPTPANPQGRQRQGPARQTPTAGMNEVKERTCGLIVSYDTAPAVPAALRGSLYSPTDPGSAARRSLASRMKVCEYCRRPKDQHQPSGPRFKEVTPGTAVSRSAPAQPRQPSPPPGPRVEDITDRLAIEPAPPSA